jgi:hypothetical protein
MRLAFLFAAAALVAACNRPAETAAPAPEVTLESVRVPADNRVNQISGLVTKREMGTVLLDSGGPSPIALRVDAATKVTLDGQPATGAELREGTLVRAAYRFNASGEPMAPQVVANTRPQR